MFIVAIVASLFFGITNASAMTESDLLAKLSKTYTINGVDFKAEPEAIVLAEQYLQQYEVSSDDAIYISNKIDEVVNFIENGSATSKETLSNADKKKIIEVVDDISDKTSVKAAIEKGTLVIYNTDGTVFARVTDLVKNTGSNELVVIVSSAIAALGIVFIARKMKKANA